MESQRGVRIWLGGMCLLVLLMVAVGGITRLTGSGLSMTDWKPILGVRPPLNELEWQERFDQYRAFPEFQQLRPEMTLPEFKGIFFWEYTHRMLGRGLGLAFVLPMLGFWVRGRLHRRLTLRLLVALLLGAGQGLLGWFMVKSGLADQPFVSPFRLAAHLLMAFLLLVYLEWLLLDLRSGLPPRRPANLRAGRRLLHGFTLLLILQIVYGAFVAGLDAGFTYNTWPKMNGFWLPPGMLALEPAWTNVFKNHGTVQFIHRTLAYLLVLLLPLLLMALRKSRHWAALKKPALLLSGLLLLQVLLGILTLVFAVPVPLGVLHQVTAGILLAACALLLHRMEHLPAKVGEKR